MQRSNYIATNPLMWLVVAVVAFLVVGQYHSAKAEDQQSKQGYVQTLCDSARVSGDFTQCYAAESSTNSEYLCNSASCWVEVH